jgi:hypothetical protein
MESCNSITTKFWHEIVVGAGIATTECLFLEVGFTRLKFQCLLFVQDRVVKVLMNHIKRMLA